MPESTENLFKLPKYRSLSGNRDKGFEHRCHRFNGKLKSVTFTIHQGAWQDSKVALFYHISACSV